MCDSVHLRPFDRTGCTVSDSQPAQHLSRRLRPVPIGFKDASGFLERSRFHEEAGSYVNNARLTRRRFALLQRQWLLRGAQVFSVSQIGVTL